jgi:hypothetical protein
MNSLYRDAYTPLTTAGGAERQFFEELRELRARGHHVRALTFELGDEALFSAGLARSDVTVLIAGGWSQVRAAPALARIAPELISHTSPELTRSDAAVWRRTCSITTVRRSTSASTLTCTCLAALPSHLSIGLRRRGGYEAFARRRISRCGAIAAGSARTWAIRRGAAAVVAPQRRRAAPVARRRLRLCADACPRRCSNTRPRCAGCRPTRRARCSAWPVGAGETHRSCSARLHWCAEMCRTRRSSSPAPDQTNRGCAP